MRSIVTATSGDAMELVFWLIVWAAVATAAAIYAHKIERSGFGWFCFAFFVPLGGILVWPILMINSSPKSREVRAVEDEVRIFEAKAKLAQLKKENPDVNGSPACSG
jgi:bacteriorhodopsin